jgi:hypothetical protein
MYGIPFFLQRVLVGHLSFLSKLKYFTFDHIHNKDYQYL